MSSTQKTKTDKIGQNRRRMVNLYVYGGPTSLHGSSRFDVGWKVHRGVNSGDGGYTPPPPPKILFHPPPPPPHPN